MSKREQSVVSVSALSKSYTQGGIKIPVLAGLQLSIAAGESVTILGVSGTGKSTLLNILSGIDPADSGRIVVDGTDIVGSSAGELAAYRRSKVGFIFQFYNLIPTLTALENVMTGWEAAGKPAKEGAVEAKGILQQLGLREKMDRFPEQLSGGEQQRVAIARALVKRPALLLADEPTGNLDPKTADATAQLLLSQAKDFAKALIIVTHNPTFGKFTDRTLVLRDGALHEATAASLESVKERVA